MALIVASLAWLDSSCRKLPIGKIVKKHPQLRELQHVQKWSNRETEKVVWLQNCSHGLENFWDPNFKIQMFSNDIFNEKIITISVTLRRHRLEISAPNKGMSFSLNFLPFFLFLRFMVCLSRLHNLFGMLAHLKYACAALEIDSLALEASYAPNSGAAVCNFNFFFFNF